LYDALEYFFGADFFFMVDSAQKPEKQFLVGGLIAACISVFAIQRHPFFSRFISLRRRVWLEENFIFSPKNPKFHTRLTYALNHTSWRHLGFNSVMLAILGREYADKDQVQLSDLVVLGSMSAIAATVAESGKRTPVIGASGIVMGLLGGLGVIDPNKTWLMILPIPGVPVTTMQLAQGTLLSHVVALSFFRRHAPSKYALASHLGGLTMGVLYSATRYDGYKQEFVSESLKQWNRTLSSAWLVVYWLYLSARIPFSHDGDKGELITKKRFIQRVWKEEF